MKLLFKLLTIMSLTIIMVGCADFGFQQQDGAPKRKINFSKIPNAVPKVLPKSSYGNPPFYTVNGITYHVRKSAIGFEERGIASWYGTKFHGRLTSTRQIYNLFAMTAAMPTIPLPAFAEVTNLENGRRIIVEVNDRGPFEDNRIIDLSYVAAGKLGMLPKGTALVEVKIIDPNTWNKNEERQLLKQKPYLSHPGHPEIFIQIGAFSEKNRAESEIEKLKNKILQNLRIQTINDHGQNLYRVQVGPIQSVTASDIVTERLINLGYPHPLTLIE